jgi:hypothetical protein
MYSEYYDNFGRSPAPQNMREKIKKETRNTLRRKETLWFQIILWSNYDNM